jgi:lysophospholipase L1-like esterase
MPKYPYRDLGTSFDRDFRNDLNANFDDIEQDFQDVDARIDNIVANAGSSNTEIVDARYDSVNNVTYPTLKDRLDTHADEIGILNSRSNMVSVTEYGAVGDGTTDCLNAFNQAKTVASSKKIPIYFPQNATGNAVYYFSSNPSLGGLRIYADKGVTLSFATTNYLSFKDVEFLTPVNIVSRDRNNTGKQEINSNIPKWLLPLSGVSEQMGMNDVQAVDLSTWTKTKYDTRVDTQTSHTYGTTSGGDYTIATGSISGGDTVASVVHAVETDAVLNMEYSAWFNHDTGRVGITAKFDNGWALFSTENSTGKIFIGKRPLGGSWSEFEVIINGATNAYRNSNKRGIQLSCRVIENALEVYINGAYADTIKGLGAVKKVGFGINGAAAVGGTIDPTIKYAICGYSPKRPKGRHLKIAVYGDSISYGEGANLDWPSLLVDALKAIPQFSRIELRNSAVSGHKASQQLSILNTEGVSGYNYTLVMVGTNDIQAQTPINTYKQNLIDIITKIRADGSQPILGVPPVFIDSASTGYGFNTSNYDKGAEYRAVVYRVCAEQGVPVADVMSYIGLVDPLNTIYRDNIHPQSFANTYIAQCFARAIFNHFQKL